MRVELEKDALRKDSLPKESKTKVQQKRYYRRQGMRDDLVQDMQPKPVGGNVKQDSFQQELADPVISEPASVASISSQEEPPVTEAMENAEAVVEPKLPENSPLREHSVRTALRSEPKEVPKGCKEETREKRIYQEEKEKSRRPGFILRMNLVFLHPERSSHPSWELPEEEHLWQCTGR